MPEPLTYVETSGLKVLYSAIGDESGQCGWYYPGAAGRCQNDAEYASSILHDGAPEPVPLCEKHANEASIE